MPWTCRSRSRFAIGLCQCLAMIPGVSRSGATIVGALLLGAGKRSAAEFSFFLAMPTMAGAFAYDLYKNCGELASKTSRASRSASSSRSSPACWCRALSAGFRRPAGFAPFAWWRIIVGGIGLGALAVLG